MSVVIRLSRSGSKGKPFYKVVATDKRSKRDGKFLEKLGTYNPLIDNGGFDIKKERFDYWVSVGAQPSKTVSALVKTVK